MKRLTIALAVLMLAAGVAHTAGAAGKPRGALSGAEIEAYFAGKRIYGTTPSGKTWFVEFYAGGAFKGVVPKGEDTGRWWIEGDTLCRAWGAWAGQVYEGRDKVRGCFHIVLDHERKRVDYYRATSGALYRSWRME